MRMIGSRDSRITAFYLLVLCNRTISSEVSSMFYGRLAFCFHEVFTFQTGNFWLDTIGTRNRGHLAHLWLGHALLGNYQDGDLASRGLPLDPTIIERLFQLLASTSQHPRKLSLAIHLTTTRPLKYLNLRTARHFTTRFPWICQSKWKSFVLFAPPHVLLK